MTLTELQYSTERRYPLRLYVYSLSHSGFHHGGVWFEREPRYPEEGEISTEEADDSGAAVDCGASRRRGQVGEGQDWIRVPAPKQVPA